MGIANIRKFNEPKDKGTAFGSLIDIKVPEILPGQVKKSATRLGAGLPPLIGGIGLGIVSRLVLKGKGKLQTAGYVGSAVLAIYGIYKLVAKDKETQSEQVIKSVFLSGQLPMPNITTDIGRAADKAKKDIAISDVGRPWQAVNGSHDITAEIKNSSSKLRHSVVIDLYKANIEDASKKPIGNIELVGTFGYDLKPDYKVTWTKNIPEATINEWKKSQGRLKMRFIVFSALDTQKLYPIASSLMILLEK